MIVIEGDKLTVFDRGVPQAEYGIGSPEAFPAAVKVQPGSHMEVPGVDAVGP